MVKKLFITATAAAAVSVPLASVAWADTPSDSGSSSNASGPASSSNATDAGTSNGNGIGPGGMPQRLGDFAATGVTPPLAASNDPIPPGQEFNAAKDYYAAVHPGQKVNTPTAIGEFESFVWTNRTLADGTVIPNDPNAWANITPGLAIKPLTPGCGKGHTGVPGSTQCVP